MVRAPRASPQAWDPGSSSSRELELRDFAQTHAHADMKIKAGRQLIDNVRILQGGIMHEWGIIIVITCTTYVYRCICTGACKEGRKVISLQPPRADWMNWQHPNYQQSMSNCLTFSGVPSCA